VDWGGLVDNELSGEGSGLVVKYLSGAHETVENFDDHKLGE
jgi:hypothetical protein